MFYDISSLPHNHQTYPDYFGQMIYWSCWCFDVSEIKYHDDVFVDEIKFRRKIATDLGFRPDKSYESINIRDEIDKYIWE